MPDVPTIAEAGVPGYEATIWLGLMAPKGTPTAIVSRLNGEVVKIVSNSAVVKARWAQGAVAMPMSVVDFDKYLGRHRQVGAGRRDFGRQARAVTPASLSVSTSRHLVAMLNVLCAGASRDWSTHCARASSATTASR